MNALFYPLNKLNTEVETERIFTNRGFLFGDGFFESMRYHNGKIQFYDDHFERIKRAFHILKLSTAFLNKESLLLNLMESLNSFSGDARVRLTFFRVGGGLYTPDGENAAALIQTQSWPSNQYELNEKPVSLGIYNESFKSRNIISSIKSLNALIYVLAGIYARENKFDDVLILNDNENICEAVSSNFFLVKNRVIYTPPVSEGCVEGVMRKQVFKFARASGIKTEEIELNQTDLQNADEVFLTTGTKGFITVGNFHQITFKKEIVLTLHERLMEATS